MGKRPKEKMKPRQAATVRANLKRFPLDNPVVRAALCRIMDTALAKIIAEDTEIEANLEKDQPSQIGDL